MTDIAPLRRRIAESAARIGAMPVVFQSKPEEAIEQFSNEALLRLSEDIRQTQFALDALKVVVSGVLAARSAPELGAASLARTAGHANATQLIGDMFSLSGGESARLMRVAEATRERMSVSGETLPPKYRAIRDALDAGTVSLEAANIIAGTLDSADGQADPELLSQSEQALLNVAAEAPLGDLRKSGEHVKTLLSQNDAELSERERRAKRMLIIRQLRSGLTRIEWELPPEDAALVVPAIEAACRQANLASGRSGFADEEGVRNSADVQFERPLTDRDGRALPAGAGALHFDLDGRPSSELAKRFARARSDAAVEIFRHSSRCRCDGRKGIPTVTAIVRIDYETLINQLKTEGNAARSTELDGVPTPIAAGTARRLAVDANILPAVMGADSIPLDLGMARRAFTRAQRLALLDRDGGCAAPGCSAPPAWCDVHHIVPWSEGGATDVSNGVVLCSAHHHRVHENGWRIRIEPSDPAEPGSPTVPWFYPPPGWVQIDPQHRHRIRGGRVRITLAA